MEKSAISVTPDTARPTFPACGNGAAGPRRVASRDGDDDGLAAAPNFRWRRELAVPVPLRRLAVCLGERSMQRCRAARSGRLQFRRLILEATNLVEGASAAAAEQGGGGFVCFSKLRGRHTDEKGDV